MLRVFVPSAALALAVFGAAARADEPGDFTPWEMDAAANARISQIIGDMPTRYGLALADFLRAREEAAKAHAKAVEFQKSMQK